MSSPLYVRSDNGTSVDETFTHAPPTGVTVAGVRHPKGIFTTWTDAELAAIGYYRVTPDTLTANHTENSRSYTRNGDRFDETISSTALTTLELARQTSLSRDEFFDRMTDLFDPLATEAQMPDFLWRQFDAAIDNEANAADKTLLQNIFRIMQIAGGYPFVRVNLDNQTSSQNAGSAMEFMLNKLCALNAGPVRNIWATGTIPSIDRANCPLQTVPTNYNEIEDLKTRVTTLEAEVNALQAL